MKLTIVITNYNSIDYWKKLYTSLIMQSCRDFKIILVDDCSIDGSFEEWQKVAEHFKDFKLYKTEQNTGGPSIPRNIGMSYVDTEYVTFVDGDDALGTHFVKSFYETINESDYDYLYDNTNEWRITWCHSGFYKTDLIRKYDIKFPTIDDYNKYYDHTYSLKFAVNEDAIFSLLLYSLAENKKGIETKYAYSTNPNSLLNVFGKAYENVEYAKYSYKYYLDELERLKKLKPDITIPEVWCRRLRKHNFT